MPYTFRYGDRPLEGVTVQRAVGRGGFGEVYYALTDSGKQIALKYLRENPEIELRGIAQVMNLKSPHLITIYDVRNNAAGEPFVVMEYVSGPSLRELLLAAPGGLGPQKAAYFVDSIAKGLAYLHDRGIVHRDLKPANIFYDDGYVKIGDYGLSKHISVSRHSGQTVSVGTVHYMAPEIGSGSYTKAIDIYALGVILYEMLTGRLPFSGSSMGEILMRHLSDRPDLAGIPEPFATVLAKALAKDPRDRYQDASEMADALRQYADLTASIASFDHSTLNNVPRRDDAVDPEQTRTTPHVPPPPPPLDVWTPPTGRADVLADKMQKKMENLARKFQQKTDKIAAKRGGATGVPPWSPPGPLGGSPAIKPNRKTQFLILLGVMIAVGVGLGILHGGPHADEVSVALVFCIAAATVGPLLAYFRFLQRSPVQSGVWDRLVYVAVTALFMVPAFGMASDFASRAASLPQVQTSMPETAELQRGAPEDPDLQSVREALRELKAEVKDGVRVELRQNMPGRGTPRREAQTRSARMTNLDRDARFMNMLVAPLAMLVVCDWSRRIRTGRLGEVRGRDAIWPALVGLIAASIADAEGFQFAAAAVCATASLLTQAAAAMWPYPARAAVAAGYGPGGYAGAACCGPAVREGMSAPARPVSAPPTAGDITGPQVSADLAGATTADGAVGEQRTVLPVPVVIDASPSFVGRAANAGVSLLGKVLLLIGLTLAIGHDALRDRVQAAGGHFMHGSPPAVFTEGLPGPVVLGIPLLGGLLLVLSRRRQGAAHVLRGCLGCGLTVCAAIAALGPAAGALRTLFTSSRWSQLDWGQLTPQLMLAGAPLLAALVLLTWPRRQDQTVVI